MCQSVLVVTPPGFFYNQILTNKQRILIAALVCLLAAVPFLVVKFPPITDLPQHAAQVRLFGEALGHPDSPYRIQWLTPYNLVYTVLGMSWVVFGPEDAGRFGMLLVALLWIVMLHLLVARLKRPAPAAVFASLLFFSHILYWGFYQFAFGWLLFLGFLLVLDVRFRTRGAEALASIGVWAALYFSHILWFLLAVAWLGFRQLFLRRDLKTLLFRGAGAAPFLALAAAWYPTLAARGFRSETIWATNPFQRLFPSWLVDASFGGLRGSVEYAFFGVFIVWILWAWLSNRGEFKLHMDRELILLGCLFFLLMLVLPDEQTNTIRFSQRWLPPALAFLLLGLPGVRAGRRILIAVAFSVLAAFFVLTALNWRAFERDELSGLRESLAALPSNPRVIGLSYLKESAVVRGRPFIQIFSYAQVYRGGELNFSFADFAPSLVVYRRPRVPDWTSGLEWLPGEVKRSDLAFFDFALIGGDDNLHSRIGQDKELTPMTFAGRWRLYRTSAPARRQTSGPPLI
jgi:hypothetical protein